MLFSATDSDCGFSFVHELDDVANKSAVDLDAAMRRVQLAMQKSDWELGRVYLPGEDRLRFGVTALDRPSPELTELLSFEAARARELLAAGRVLHSRIGGRVGRAVGLFARGGLAALEALESANWDVFTQRPRPSRARLALAALAR